jgi:hypothetical protein
LKQKKDLLLEIAPCQEENKTVRPFAVPFCFHKKVACYFFMTLYKDFLLSKIRSARLLKNELSRKGQVPISTNPLRLFYFLPREAMICDKD